ncbi:MAG: hypothetical protein OEX17_06295 [Rhodospirillaceae bacterium]|nr:hypothetical protein [Rhodospirillaceae bacterium]
MKISVKQTKNGVFSLTLDDAVITLDMGQMKKLLLECVQAMAPGAVNTVDPDVQAAHLAEKLKTANPPGLQKLIMSASEDDILMVLKSCEEDTSFIDWIFQNMSDRKQTMFKEDMEFKFHDGVPGDDLADAVENLNELVARLKSEGSLELDS